MDETQTGGEHRFKADRARRRFGKWQPLGFDVLRIVIRHDHVDEAGAHRFDERFAVVLRAQWRRHLQECAVGPDVDFIERDVIDRGRSGDIQSRILCAAQDFQRLRAGHDAA